MRNRRNTRMWIGSTLATLCLMSGCVPPEGAAAGPQPGQIAQPAPAPQRPLKPAEVQPVINAAYASFNQRRYDEAMSSADRVLAGNPNGPGAAEAHYLRGRVLEERAKAAEAAKDIPGARAALQAAREAYNAALAAKPAPAVEGNTRAGIANVAYFQEDYATAIAQGTAAQEKITDPQVKAWVLYRVGLSQQRFGSFPEADRTFAMVEQQFPNTDQARRSAAHRGVNGFYVQVGTYESPTNADNALAGLRAEGVIGMRLTDPNGRNVVRVGPMRTYDEAKKVRARVAGKHPDALIIP